MASASPANRQFYSIPSQTAQSGETSQQNEIDSSNVGVPVFSPPQKDIKAIASSQDKESDDLLAYISRNVIGMDKIFSGPFGLRKVTYLDYVASGRSLNFIEDYIRSEVLPEYGNTHTTTSVTSLQTTLFRHEARDILRNSFNASEHDSVIFTGSGSTGAIHKLIHALNVKKGSTIVIVGPYEHHSNILPWKEAGAEVIRINQSKNGSLDMNELESKLKSLQGLDRRIIGAFSAASNVTGFLSDVDAITILLHKYGALAVWDFACAAPYVKIDMNPYIGGPDQPYVYKDAVVLSVHKFVGGTSTPGVLMAKKKLFTNSVPDGCGGGTVFFVRRENHRYLQEPESREEGGTPAIVESIRAGLVVQLKEAVGVNTIMKKDNLLVKQAQEAWSNCPELVLLGTPLSASEWPEKLPIFSFLILHQATGRFLHHNFVAAVLNDVFGIQARGGCACAGPYAMDLLGLGEKTAKDIEELIAEDSRLDRTHLRRIREYSHREILRPGFVRLNLPYFIDEACLNFVLEAVKLTAQHAWKLLPQYLFNPETAEWRQRHFQTFKDRKWLGHISYQSGQMAYHQPKQNIKGPLPTSYKDCLLKAQQVFAEASKLRLKVPDQSVMFDEEAQPFRWFVLPSEANACLPGQKNSNSIPARLTPDELPFFPGREVGINSVEVNGAVSLDEDGKDGESGLNEVQMSEADVAKDKWNDQDNFHKAQDVCSADTNKCEAATASSKKGMVPLQDALKYADALLADSCTSKAVEEVGNAMANIWGRFGSGKSKENDKSETVTQDPVEEVSQRMQEIWNNFAATKPVQISEDKSNSVDESGQVDLPQNDNTITCDDVVLEETHQSENPDVLEHVKSVEYTENSASAITEGSRLGRMRALEDALKYADSVLEKTGGNEQVVEVTDEMSNLWQKFDVRKSEGIQDEPEATLTTVANKNEDEPQLTEDCNNEKDEVSRIKASNSSPAPSKDFIPSMHDAVNRTDNSELTPGSLKPVEEVCSVMSGIWKSFSSKAYETGKSIETESQGFKATDDKPINGPEKSKHDASSKKDVYNPPALSVDDVDNVNVSHANVNQSNRGQNTEASEDTAEVKGNTATTESLIDQDNAANDDARIKPRKDGMIGLRNMLKYADSLLEGSSTNKAVMEVENVMGSIWKSYDSKVSSSTTGATLKTSTTELKINGEKWDKKKEPVIHGNIAEDKSKSEEQGLLGTPSQSISSADLTKCDLPIENGICSPGQSTGVKNFRIDAINEIKVAMDEIWENFTPRKNGNGSRKDFVPVMATQGKTGNEALAEARNQLNAIWEKAFEGQNVGKYLKDDANDTEESKDGSSLSQVLEKFSKIENQRAGRGKAARKTESHEDSNDPIESVGLNVLEDERTFQETSMSSFSEGMIKALGQGFGGETEKDVENKSQKVDKINAAMNIMNKDDNNSVSDEISQTTNHRKSAPLEPKQAQKERGEVNKMNSSGDAFVCPLVKPKKDLPVKLIYESSSADQQESMPVQWFAPPKQIFKPAVAALEEYSMIKEGDRLLVCLSGGKDSLSLLHTIRQYQFYAKGKGISFEFGAVTVDPMTPAYDPSPLKQYLASLGVPYFYESQCILETAEQLPYECASICSFCSRMKRGRIYAAARREGYNLLALGQHLDDLTESFLMSFFHNGNLNTMKAHYTIKQGDLRVIRPFVYVREADLRAFAEMRKLPVISENCPACFEAPKERHRTKQLLAAQEVMFPQVYSSMMAALKPLMARSIGSKPIEEEMADTGED